MSTNQIILVVVLAAIMGIWGGLFWFFAGLVVCFSLLWMADRV